MSVKQMTVEVYRARVNRQMFGSLCQLFVVTAIPKLIVPTNLQNVKTFRITSSPAQERTTQSNRMSRGTTDAP
ncbi:hypothetical protein LIPSTDRAFT_102552 [Lipomyces starkeyi NRRL Y-11557]|uniref:Uncharacterized protein n=1 Tax=Lipomyces starkeyi NRRL Y-11557 TaxID=675824 RepID=A0A1E3QE93_LIPST|nr:hypothetical protein LIPSTDRAFT_102552 [Lipomyces starkeyi NRRL Y-11557]